MRFRKIYIEISNLCNLKCSFCPGTKRQKRRMTAAEFSALLPKIRPYTDFIYFHLMGEPLCHPELENFLNIAHQFGFRVIVTTNGTLLPQTRDILLSAPALHKINISLHAFEANDCPIPFSTYLDNCFAFGKAAAGQKLVVYRLWNHGGKDELNGNILEKMRQFFPENWVVERQGTRIAHRTYLEYGDKFDWPDLSVPEENAPRFCYGLRDQLGILCDGTVVPCCLDHEGDIALGNLFTQDLEEILQSPRAQAIYNGFTSKEAIEPLCRRCGYARRFG